MPANPPILLLDTNVWLDLFLPMRPGRETALALVAEAQAREAPLAFPSHAVLDVYQKVRADNKRWIRTSRALTEVDALAIKRMAWDFVAIMRQMATAVPMDTNDLTLACSFRDGHDDLEDDLVLAACQRAHADYLVTNDAALLAHAPLPALTPASMLELLRTGRAEGKSVASSDSGSVEWLYRWFERYGSQG